CGGGCGGTIKPGIATREGQRGDEAFERGTDRGGDIIERGVGPVKGWRGFATGLDKMGGEHYAPWCLAHNHNLLAEVSASAGCWIVRNDPVPVYRRPGPNGTSPFYRRPGPILVRWIH